MLDPRDRTPHQLQVHLNHPAGPRDRTTHGPSASTLISLITLVPLAGTLLFLAGVTLLGSVIGLAISTPVFILFSPVIVPAALLLGFAVTGVLSSGALGLTGLASLSRVAGYVRQVTERVPEELEYAKRRIADVAAYAGQKTKDVGQTVENKARESGTTTTTTETMADRTHTDTRDQTRRTHTDTRDQTRHQLPVHPQQPPGARDRTTHGPSASTIIALITLVPLAGILLFLAGISLLGSVIGLAISTPVFILFSPVIVPAALLLGFAVTGVLSSGALGLTGLASLSRVAGYVRQVTERVPEELEYAKRRIADVAAYAGQKTKDVGQTVENKARESGTTTTTTGRA